MKPPRNLPKPSIPFCLILFETIHPSMGSDRCEKKKGGLGDDADSFLERTMLKHSFSLFFIRMEEVDESYVCLLVGREGKARKQEPIPHLSIETKGTPSPFRKERTSVSKTKDGSFRLDSTVSDPFRTRSIERTNPKGFLSKRMGRSFYVNLVDGNTIHEERERDGEAHEERRSRSRRRMVDAMDHGDGFFGTSRRGSSSLFRKRETSHVRRLRSSKALDGNHLTHTHERMVQGDGKQSIGILGTGLSTSFCLSELDLWKDHAIFRT